MIWLGQTTQSTAFDYSVWIPTTREALWAGLVFVSILLVGALILRVLRGMIQRTLMSVPLAVALLALSSYFALIALRPGLMRERVDLISLWSTRLFTAAMLFVLVRAIDRLIVVPLLSRGGKVPVQRFVQQIINCVIILFAVLGYGSWAFGWDIDKFLAGSAVVSIVLGLALQETLGNFFSGLVMQASSPFSLGDWIVCGGVEGRVVDMTWRAVTVHTAEDNYVLIPNSTVAKEQIINFNAPTNATAREIMVGLEYELAPNEAIEVLMMAAKETPGVLESPPPFVYLQNYASSAIEYRVKFWIAEPARHPQIEHFVRLNTWYRLKQRGFNIPFQIQTVEIVDLMKKMEKDSELATARRARTIGTVSLFAVLSREQRAELARRANDLQLARGQVLFRQDDPGDSFYILQQGSVDVLIRQNNVDVKVATLNPGDFFGEMSALTGQPRTATIRAATSIWCVEIGKDDLHEMFEHDPGMMEKLSLIIAQRNADRASAAQGAAASPSAQAAVATEQKNILSRMMRFFGLGAGDA